MIKKGFTLIELLIVIALLAIVATAVLVLINPVEKMNQANDAKIQSDISQIITALQSYATSHSGLYPCATAGGIGCPNGTGAGDGLAALVTAGEFSAVPKPSTGYGTAYEYASTNGTSARVEGVVKQSKWSSYGFWSWCNTSGEAGPAYDNGCPNAPSPTPTPTP